MQQRTYIKNFKKNGYVVIRNFISKSSQDKLSKDLIFSFQKNLKLKSINEKNIHRILHNLERNSDYDGMYNSVKKFHQSNSFKNTVEKIVVFSNNIFKKKFKVINLGMAQGMNNSNRTSYKWHQEKSYYKNKNTLHFQFPILNKCNKKNGTMSVLKKSHLLGRVKKTKFFKKHNKSVSSKTPKNINKILKQFSEQFINLKKSDLILFHENLLHRSNKNFTNKVRFAGIVRVQERLNRVK